MCYAGSCIKAREEENQLLWGIYASLNMLQEKSDQPPKKSNFSLKVSVKSGEPQIRYNLDNWSSCEPNPANSWFKQLVNRGNVPESELRITLKPKGAVEVIFSIQLQFNCTRRWLKCGLKHESSNEYSDKNSLQSPGADLKMAAENQERMCCILLFWPEPQIEGFRVGRQISNIYFPATRWRNQINSSTHKLKIR